MHNKEMENYNAQKCFAYNSKPQKWLFMWFSAFIIENYF